MPIIINLDVMLAKRKMKSKELAEIIKINAANNASDLVKNSSIISDAVNAGNLTIESAYYNLGSGKVEFT